MAYVSERQSACSVEHRFFSRDAESASQRPLPINFRVAGATQSGIIEATFNAGHFNIRLKAEYHCANLIIAAGVEAPNRALWSVIPF
jgi:hypothetical protein